MSAAPERRESAAGRRDRLVVDVGEEARLTPDGETAAAEIRSRGPLPLRVRREEIYRLRPPFPGTAVDLGAATYEVVDQHVATDGSVIYRLRPWPAGETARDRIAYDGSFVRGVQDRRARARLQAWVRPFRFVLYPFVGLLPEEAQVRLCDRLGFDAASATAVSGLAESLGVATLLALLTRRASTAAAVVLVLLAPLLAGLILPGLGRAFGALAFRQAAGNSLIAVLVALLRRKPAPPDDGVGPLTRAAFWRRLDEPDRHAPQPDGALYATANLPHLTWTTGYHVLAPDGGFWAVTADPPVLQGDRIVYGYRLRQPGPAEAGPAQAAGAMALPTGAAYREEVLDGVQREWDGVLFGFSWAVALAPEGVQRRATRRCGGPARLRRGAYLTAAVGMAVGAYLLSFLPGPPDDPLAPFVLAFGATLLAEGPVRLWRAAGGRYAPSLFGYLAPWSLLRPERVAWEAHRDAELTARRALEG